MTALKTRFASIFRPVEHGLVFAGTLLLACHLASAQSWQNEAILEAAKEDGIPLKNPAAWTPYAEEQEERGTVERGILRWMEEVRALETERRVELLAYSFGRENSVAWRASSVKVQTSILPERANIEPLVSRVVSLLKEPATRANRVQLKLDLASLSEVLLSPLELDRKTQRLLLVDDPLLRGIPFAVLPDPSTITAENPFGDPIVRNYEVVRVGSFELMEDVKRNRRDGQSFLGTIAVIADPIYEADDPRIPPSISTSLEGRRPGGMADSRSSAGTIEFSRLWFSSDEARRILELIPQAKTAVALGTQASREEFLRSEFPRYRILHFAVHGGIRDEQNVEPSLILSLVDEYGNFQNGFLTSTDISKMSISSELVVLSACSTTAGNLGAPQGRFNSLPNAFIHAGASRVLATSWSINDRVTVEFMAKFYEALFKGGQSPASALREAQLMMLRSSRNFDPYYWAGFELHGDWLD